MTIAEIAVDEKSTRKVCANIKPSKVSFRCFWEEDDLLNLKKTDSKKKKTFGLDTTKIFFLVKMNRSWTNSKKSRTIWISFKFFLYPKYFSLKEPTLKFQFRARFSKLLSQYLLSLVFTFSDFSVLPEGQKDSWTVLLELFRMFGF